MVFAILLSATGHTRADDAADNPDLEAARTALDDLKYAAASTALDKALQRGGNSPVALAEIYRLKGEVAAALGEEADAVESFKALLAIQPDARLAAGVSPKIGEPFRAAQTATEADGPLALSCEIDRGPPVELTLVLESDPLHLVRGMSVVLRAEGKRAPLAPDGAHPFRAVVPRDARAVAAVAVDEYGNQVRILLVDSCTGDAPVKHVRKKRTTPRERPRPLYARWALWAGVALSGAAVGTYFGLEAMSTLDELDRINQDSANHEFEEADRLESTARRNALWANLGFAVAGAAAVAATVLFLRRDHGRSERSAVLVPAAGPDSVGMALFLSF